MIKFEKPKQSDSIIKIIGVGGGGNNAIQYMFKQGISGVDFIACNTDKQVLDKLDIPSKIQLGKQLTQGLGAGGNPEKGRQAAEESTEELRAMLGATTKLVFIASGMGGGTGTGAAPVIAKICRELGIVTIGVVTMPFSFEGPSRSAKAQEGLKNLREQVDTLIVINNDKINDFYGSKSVLEVFLKVDEVLNIATQSITDIIENKGVINLDFSDICAVVKDGGNALIGQARKSGEQRINEIVEETLNCPLLNDNDIFGAKKMVVNLTMSDKNPISQSDMDRICQEITMRAGGDADVYLGVAIDTALDDAIQLTIIATGFKQNQDNPLVVEKKTLIYPECSEAPEPMQVPLQEPLPTSSVHLTPNTSLHSGHTDPSPSLSPSPSFSPSPPVAPTSPQQDTPSTEMCATTEQPFELAVSNVPHSLEEDTSALQSFVQRGEAEKRKRAEQLQAYTTHLPTDFENPNSDAYANAYDRKGYTDAYQWERGGQDLGTSMLKKEDDGSIYFSTENKFIDGNTPD